MSETSHSSSPRGKTKRVASSKKPTRPQISTESKRSLDDTPGRTRTATFVQGKDHVSRSNAQPMSGTMNVVSKRKLRTQHMGLVGESSTIFFKAHDEKAQSQNAVAATRLARFLGMKEIIAHNAFARIDAKDGAVSGQVPGVPLLKYMFDKEYDWSKVGGKPRDKEELAGLVSSLQLVERNGKYYTRSAGVYEWVDFTDPRIQKGMSDLQLFDVISGQIDRHGGNIYVDQRTGAVSGIDDDQSFGSGLPVDHIAEPTSHYRGFPELVDEGTADRILALDPQQLPSELAPRNNDTQVLTDQEINDEVARLKLVQTYLLDLKTQGKLVRNWNNDTYQMALQKPENSYLGYQASRLVDLLPGKQVEGGTEFTVENAPPNALQLLRPQPLQPSTSQTGPPAPSTLPTWAPQVPRGRPLGLPPSRLATSRMAATRTPPTAQKEKPSPPSPIVIDQSESSDSSHQDDTTISSADHGSTQNAEQTDIETRLQALEALLKDMTGSSESEG